MANNYEREEEFLTNELSRKLQQIREEKHSLEQSLEQEQATQINQLMKRIQRLEAETTNKQNTLVIDRSVGFSWDFLLSVSLSGTIKTR